MHRHDNRTCVWPAAAALLVLLAMPGLLRAEAAWLAERLDQEGWLDVPALIEAARQAGGRVIHVSSSSGHDMADGQSPLVPKRTLASARGMLRDGQPDVLLLKRGDTFTEPLGHMPTSGRSAQLPRIISAYGEGDRPLIQTRHEQRGLSFTGSGGGGQTSHLVIHGIHLRATQREREHAPVGIFYLRDGRNLWIEDCVIEGYKDNIVIQGEGDGPQNIVLRRSVIVDAYSPTSHAQGIYLAGARGVLIEQNLFDRNGWSQADRSDATIFNHNLYIQHNNRDVTVRQNIVTRGASHGVQLRSGGVIEENVFIGNPCGVFVSGGTAGRSRVAGNLIMESGDIRADLPRGHGIEINSGYGRVERIELSDNILSSDGSARPYGFAVLCDAPERAEHSGNIVFDWRGRSLFEASGRGAFVDPARSAGTYHASLGRGGSLESFLAEARRGWRPEYSARALIAHVREGFAPAPQEPTSEAMQRMVARIDELERKLHRMERREYRLVPHDPE